MSDVLKKTFRFDRWTRWDDEIHAAVQAFRDQLGPTPNILTASEVTHARIDMAAKKANILHEDGHAPGDTEYTPLSCFHGPDYDLDFCVDDSLPTGAFSLLFDDDPVADIGETGRPRHLRAGQRYHSLLGSSSSNASRHPGERCSSTRMSHRRGQSPTTPG